MRNLLLYLFYIFIYLYIHNPIFSFLGGIGSVKLLYPVAILFFIFKFRSCIYAFKIFSSEFQILSLLILFCIFRTLIGGDTVILYQHIIMFVEVFFIGLFLIIYGANIRQYNIIYKLVLIACFASLISSVCFAVPAVGDFVRNDLLLINDSYLSTAVFRGFGISDALTSSYGFIQGFSFALSLLFVSKNKWLILFYPLFLISIIFNARTGFVIAVLGMMIYLLFNRRIKTLLLLIGLVGFIFLLIQYLLLNIDVAQGSLLFALDFFQQMSDVSDGGMASSKTMNILGDMVVWPQNLWEWILGIGESLFRHATLPNSDIGFVIQLNYGGLSYCLIWLFLFVFMYKRLKNNGISNLYLILFLMFIMVTNTKGNLLWNADGFRFLMLVYYTLIFNKRISNYEESRS